MTAILMLSLIFPQVKEEKEVFLTEKEALRVIFGDTPVVRKVVDLDKTTKERVEQRIGRRIHGRFTLFLGRRNGSVAGYAIVTEEIGKYLPITIIVGVNSRGRVIESAVMVHREPIGSDCHKKRFTNQLRGKTVNDPIRKNKDIVTIAGATLSCNAVARGTRKVLAIVDEFCLQRPDFVKRLFREEVLEQRYRMGALCTIEAKGHGAKEAVGAAFEEIQRIEYVISNYDEESEISRLSRDGKFEPGPELRRFLEVSLRYSKETHGAFDISVGAAVRAWGFRTGKHRVPSDEELEKLVVGYKGVRVENGVVRIPQGMELDPGAIGKGYAIDRAVKILEDRGMTEGVIDFGSTVYVFGKEKTIAIRDPFDTDKTLGTVTLKDEALGISGDYERFFEKNGVRYCHILDPRTRAPVRGVAGTAVIMKTATEADVFSTAIFIDPELARNRTALVIPSDREKKPNSTESWKKRFKER